MDMKKLLLGAGVVGAGYYLFTLSNSSTTQQQGGGSSAFSGSTEAGALGLSKSAQDTGSASLPLIVNFESATPSGNNLSSASTPISKKDEAINNLPSGAVGSVVTNASGGRAVFDSSGKGVILSPTGLPIGSTTSTLFKPTGSSTNQNITSPIPMSQVPTSKKASPINIPSPISTIKNIGTTLGKLFKRK